MAGFTVGSTNLYSSYVGQCTWWAAQRYYDLSGIWVAWTGNANQWQIGAMQAGWQVSGTPPKGIPSIICLQPSAGQGADPMYGHVAIVESVNSDGSVSTSDMNWLSGPVIQTVQGYPIRNVQFRPGAGVSFLYASASATKTGGGVLGVQGIISNLPAVLKTVSIAPNASVTQFLADADQAMTLINPFDVATAQQDNFAGSTFTDPISWLAGFGTNLVSDSVALILRCIFLLLGIFLLYKVLAHFVDFNALSQSASGAAAGASGLVSKLGPLLLA